MFITLCLQVPKPPESKIQEYKLVEEDLFKKAKSFTFSHKSALRFKGKYTRRDTARHQHKIAPAMFWMFKKQTNTKQQNLRSADTSGPILQTPGWLCWFSKNASGKFVHHQTA